MGKSMSEILGEKSKEIKMINISEIKNARLLNELLTENEKVYVKNPYGPDIVLSFHKY